MRKKKLMKGLRVMTGILATRCADIAAECNGPGDELDVLCGWAMDAWWGRDMGPAAAELSGMENPAALEVLLEPRGWKFMHGWLANYMAPYWLAILEPNERKAGSSPVADAI